MQSVQKYEYLGAQSPYLQSSSDNLEGAGMFQQTRLWFEDSDDDGSFDHFQLKMKHTSQTSPRSCQDQEMSFDNEPAEEDAKPLKAMSDT